MKKPLLGALLALLFALQGVAFGAADDIARLYNFSAGTTIRSAYINSEFNQLVSTMNGKAGRSVDNTLSGNNTYSGTSLFSGAITATNTATFSDATGVKTDVVTERTAANGVAVDSVTLKDGAIVLSPTAGYTPATNGAIGYDSTSHSYDVYVDGAAKVLIHTGNSASQAEMEAASDYTQYVSPGILAYHPGVAKAFFVGTVSGTTLTSRRAYGCSVVRAGVGTYTVTLTPNASDAYYAVAGSVIDGATNGGWVSTTSKATTGFTLITRRADTQAGADFSEFSFVVYGDY